MAKNSDNDADFLFADHGSITVLSAITPVALQWVDENLPEDAQKWGPAGTVIEPCYVAGIVRGILREGLVVQA